MTAVLRMPTMHVGRGSYGGGVTMFPVWTSGPAVQGLDTGRAAQVAVAERAGSPTVGELVLTNRGARPVLIVEGELLEGGWQHRAVTRDLILGAHASRVVEVACVERGRWSASQEELQRGAHRAPMTVHAAFQQERGSRQQMVWSRIAEHEAITGQTSTGSLIEHLHRAHETVGLDSIRVLPGQRGVVLGVGGQPLVLELFGSTKALTAHLPMLIGALVLDAARVAPDRASPVPGRRARRMLTHLGGLELLRLPVDAGVGRAVGNRTSHATLAGIATQVGVLAHLTVFNLRHPILEAS